MVVSPSRLSRIIETENIVIGRGLLIMSDFNIEIVKKTIEKLLQGIKGETWGDVALQVSKYAQWEYEDYNK